MWIKNVDSFVGNNIGSHSMLLISIKRIKNSKGQIFCLIMFLCWQSRAQFIRKHVWMHVFQCPVHFLEIKAYDQVLLSRLSYVMINYASEIYRESWNFINLTPKYWIYGLEFKYIYSHL